VTTPVASGGSEHLDPDLLADLAEELLDRDAASAARAHLASCTICTADYALIVDAATLLSVIDPEPIPAEVAIRIGAALEREPALGSAPERAAVPSHRAGRPLGQRIKVLFASVAGAAALIVGGFFGVSALSSSSTTSQKSSPSLSHEAAGGSSALSFANEAQVQQGALDLLAKKSHAISPNAATAPNTYKSTNECWQDPKPGTASIAMESIHYQGQPAELFVYAAGDKAADVVVVPATCSADTARTPLVVTHITRS
jgi:anti-sigma factor RsiW